MEFVCFGVLRRVALVGTGVLKERMSSIINVSRIGELLTMLALTDIIPIMMMVIRSSEISLLLVSTWRHIPKDGIFIVTVMKTSNLTYH
jgi:hypothetical protein